MKKKKYLGFQNPFENKKFVRCEQANARQKKKGEFKFERAV
jgi:hypothetical protein